MGERYDSRLERDGWSSSEYDDQNWSGVKVLSRPRVALVADDGPPVRALSEIHPIRIFATASGASVVDMGQNMVGWVRVRASGPAGTTIRLRHAEALDRDNNLYTENLRTAKEENEFVLKGVGEEVFEPHFTYQGFRYVSVEGYPGKLDDRRVTGIVVGADVPLTGRLRTSSELINKLYQNVVWSMRGNFLVVPTDCPQRDERLGWTGDAEVFAPTASFIADVDAFFRRWLGDVALDQLPSGAVPWVVPNLNFTLTVPSSDLGSQQHIASSGAAGWGDAVTVIPWQLYLIYGDKDALSRQYTSMSKWVAYEESRTKGYIWDKDFQFGDWLDYFSVEGNKLGVTTENDMVATAYFAHSTDLLRRAALVLGKEEDARRYSALFRRIQSAFVRKFVSADGVVGRGSQTAYTLALDFDLLPDGLRQGAAAHLAEDVRRWGHLTTGFLGTPHLLSVLSRFGYVDEAYMLLARKEFPSWLYPVLRGATTVWEHWDGIKPDGSFQNPQANSFNHYAYGAVGEWMYRTMAGLNPDPALPGFKHTIITPQPGGELRQVSASLETIYGHLSSEWERADRAFVVSVEIPANTKATVVLPHAQLQKIKESGRELAHVSHGIELVRQAGSAVEIDVGSGRYKFSYPWE
jgi:alpha-L-rhamnosidase